MASRETRRSRVMAGANGTVVEGMEGRVMLSGVTLITHGHSQWNDYPFWVNEMALEIIGRPESNVAAVYKVTATKDFQSSVSLTLGTRVGIDPRSADDPEIILLLDWSDIAAIGGERTMTGTVANAVAAKFTDPAFIPGLGASLAELPIHLIGHSRGGITRWRAG